jgi:hypothetical protein
MIEVYRKYIRKRHRSAPDLTGDYQIYVNSLKQEIFMPPCADLVSNLILEIYGERHNRARINL